MARYNQRIADAKPADECVRAKLQDQLGSTSKGSGPDELAPDLSQAQRYVQAFGGLDRIELFRALPHATTAKGAQVPKGRKFVGTLADVTDRLIRWNVQKCCSIYIAANQTNGRGNTKRELVAARAIWSDDDQGLVDPSKFPISPSVTVETSQGRFQYIWRVNGIDWALWDGVQARMVNTWACDPNAARRSQLLRVPGFYHLKRAPFMSRIIDELSTFQIHSAAEITAAFPPVDTGRRRPAKRCNFDGEVDPRSDIQLVRSAFAAIDRELLRQGGRMVVSGEDRRDRPVTVDWRERSWWLRAMMCIKNSSGGSTEGYQLAVDVSCGNGALELHGYPPKFDAADQARVWDSIRTEFTGERLTIATIYWIADRFCGWSPRRGGVYRRSSAVEISAEALRVKEAGILCLAAGLNRVLVEHEQATARLYRKSPIRLELARALRAGIDPNTGVGAISSQAELATNLRCTVEAVERYLRDMASVGLLVKSSGREVGLHGRRGASYALTLPGDRVRAMAEAAQEPKADPENDNVTNLHNPDANNATNLHNPDSRPDWHQVSHTRVIEGDLSVANPVDQVSHGSESVRIDRTNRFLASIVVADFDWLTAAKAASDYRAAWLWQVMPGRTVADLITVWLSSGLLPDDVCQKISERISKALNVNSGRGVSLDNLIRDIDALTDALASLFEQTQGDLDALNVSLAAAVKGCVDWQAYRVRRTTNCELAEAVDLPDVGALPPSQFISDLINKLHRGIDKLSEQPFGTSMNEASARLGRRIFIGPQGSP
jgi:hypothetical protein